ncbi:MAG: DegT/DnrJ/EryC1/StrS family aminotransferase [Pseudomonadota bacterium]
MAEPIHLARPWLTEAEPAALRLVFDSGILSRGQALEAFEQGMADAASTDHGVGVNAGTTAIQIALEAFGIGPGDEVITTSYTFNGTLNANARSGARPVLVDKDPTTLNVDPARLAEAIGANTRAIVIVHLFGRPAPMQAIREAVGDRPIRLIEDACEAIGACYQGQPVGGLADAGTFGFYPNKPVATGEGGMITASDPAFITRCRQLRNQGLDPISGTRHPSRSGLSARLSELQAAVGAVQLARLEASLARRQAIADRYLDRLQAHAALECPAPYATGDRLAWFTFPLRTRSPGDRDRLRLHLKQQRIETGQYFPPAHRLPPYRDWTHPHDLSITESVGQRCLALPLHPLLSLADVDRVCAEVLACVDRPSST